mgnify:FL=1
MELPLFESARPDKPAALPALYTSLPEEELLRRIAARKVALGDRLLILGHHYQADEVLRFADFRGDSYKLACDAAKVDRASWIIFLGVHFMAESADILTSPDQAVLLPDLRAGCTMADMADRDDVLLAWDEISNCSDEVVVPITYINSAASLKDFVGRHGGAVCTSSNARKVVSWAFERGRKLLFFPDQHLGRNVCYELGIPLEDMLVWDPAERLGGHSEAEVAKAKVLLWKGHCSVHQGFRVEHIDYWRRERPDITVMVHPECSWEVVQRADRSGSTAAILDAVASAAPGSAWAIGTEIHLVKRLQTQYPDRFVTSLSPFQCLCATMYRIRPSYLLWMLDGLAEGVVRHQVAVPPSVAEGARVALQRMIDITSGGSVA